MNIRELLKDRPELIKTIIYARFCKADVDNDGFITSEDIIRDFGMTDKNISIVMQRFDAEPDGKVSYKSFKRAFIKLINELY